MLQCIKSSTNLAVSPRVLVSFLTKYSKRKKPRLFIKDKDVTANFKYIILSNTPLIYIKKKMSKNENYCEILIFISCFLLLCLHTIS